MKNLLFVLPFLFLFYSCDESFPRDSVYEGKQNLIVYKIEEIKEGSKEQELYRKYKYAISDASGKGWTLKSFQKFNIGDTLRITNKNINN